MKKWMEKEKERRKNGNPLLGGLSAPLPLNNAV